MTSEAGCPAGGTAGNAAGRLPYLAAVALLPVILLGRAFLPGNVLSPASLVCNTYPWQVSSENGSRVDPVLGDVTFLFTPWLMQVSREVRQGRFPFWNRDSYAGSPLFGNMQSGVFSPFNALAYFLPLQLALGLAAVLKLEVAGLGMFLLLGILEITPAAAFIGAASFMLSGFVVAWLGWARGSVGIWLPFLFLAVELVGRSGKRRDIGCLALVVALQFIGGLPETSLHILAAAGAWTLFRARSFGGGRFLARVVAGVALGAGIVLVQFGPFWEYLVNSETYAIRRQGVLSSIEPWFSVLYLVPRFFGFPGEGTGWFPPLSGNYNEASMTVGLLPWLLLPLAAISGRREPVTRFFLFATLLCLVVVLDNPVFPRLLACLPGFGMVSNARLLLVAGFGLSVLGARGVDAVLSGDPGRGGNGKHVTRMAVALMVLVAALFLYSQSRIPSSGALPVVQAQVLWSLGGLACGAILLRRVLSSRGRARWHAPALAAFQVATLWPFASSYYPVIPSRDFYPTPPSIEYLKLHARGDRVLLPTPNAASVYGLSDVAGYDGMTPSRISRLVGGSSGGATSYSVPLKFALPVDSRVLDLCNVGYVYQRPDEPRLGGRFVLEYEGKDGRIYRNPRVLDRIFWVGRVRSYPDEGKALAAVRSGAVSFRREAAVTGDRHAGLVGGAGEGKARILASHPGHYEVRVSAEIPGLLVMSEGYDRGWRATVDGAPVEVIPANYAFCGVPVPAGEHIVRLDYRPRSLIPMAVLSIIAVCVTFAFLVL